MKMAQTVAGVHTHTHTHTSNFKENKQANNVSFINNTKKADYMRNVRKPRTKGLEKVQKIA